MIAHARMFVNVFFIFFSADANILSDKMSRLDFFPPGQ